MQRSGLSLTGWVQSGLIEPVRVPEVRPIVLLRLIRCVSPAHVEIPLLGRLLAFLF